MEYRLVPAEDGVDKVIVGNRWVGHVSRDPAADRELWLANLGEHGCAALGSQYDAIQHVLRHAAENPDFEMPL